MKMIAFTRDMRPHVKGETRVVPDDVAVRLIAEGAATAHESVFDAAPAEPSRPATKRARPYQTRKVP